MGTQIKYVWDFNRELAEPYAWPGGYPRYFLTYDGVLSFEAAHDNAELIRDAIIANDHSNWQVVGVEINWEDEELICEHTGKHIESAYGESK